MRKMASMVHAGLFLGLLAGCSGEEPYGGNHSSTGTPSSNSESEAGSGSQTDNNAAEPADASGSGNR